MSDEQGFHMHRFMRNRISELEKELEAYRAQDTPAFEEVCMRNQALTAEIERLRELRRCVIAEAHAYRHYEQGDLFMILMGLLEKAVAAEEAADGK